MSERRYDDREVETIFRTAADGKAIREASPDAKLTLVQLQAIGREAGLSPDAIARAAAALDVRTTTVRRTWLGMPFGVTHTVELGRTMEEDEWQRFIARLREVFDAQGRTGADGATKFWGNGNLRVLLEPVSSGHRLHFRTYNDGARALVTIGVLMLGFGVAVAAAGIAKGSIERMLPGMVFFDVIGLGALATSLLRIPSWARLRAQQMKQLGEEAATERR